MCLEPYLSKFTLLNEFPIYMDVNNIAYSRYNNLKKPVLSDILLVCDYLINRSGFKKENVYCISDPSLKYYIDKPIEYQALIGEGIIIEAPKVADEFILSFALKHEFCFIISNDRFREYLEQLPSKEWLEDRRISFMIINEEVCLSPNLNYEKILQNQSYVYLKEIPSIKEKTTLEILKRIEKSEGKLDLF